MICQTNREMKGETVACQAMIGLLDETPDGLNRHDVEAILSYY